jgi:glycosyltransferase involved in cell wall biosynthesis
LIINKFKRSGKLKILWVGCPLDEKTFTDIINRDKGFPQISANKLQWSMINGLEDVMDGVLDIISFPTVGSYPKFPQLFFKRRRWSHNEGSINIYIMFFNIPIIKYIIMTLSILFEIIVWSLRNRKSRKIVMCYSPFFHQLFPIYITRRLFRLKYITIVPDFPDDQYDIDGYNNDWRHRLIKPFSKISMFLTMSSDASIALAERGVKKMEMTDKPSILIEGCVDEKWMDFEIIPLKKEKTHRLFYGGSFDGRFGLKTLLEAFELLNNEDLELWLCGEGNMRTEVERRASENNKIKYFGVVTPNEFMNLTQQCTILINPRPANGVFTDTSFPSKTLDFMAAERPVVMYKLGGLPKEYYPYLYFFEDISVEEMAGSIRKVINLPFEELLDKSQKARSFVLKEKNKSKQMEKAYNMVSRL